MFPFTLDVATAHDLQITPFDGGYEIATTGPDPTVLTSELPEGWSLGAAPVMALESFSTTGCAFVRLAPDPVQPGVTEVEKPGPGHTEAYTVWFANLGSAMWDGGATRRILLRFGDGAGRALRVRSLQLRAALDTDTAGISPEQRAAEESQEAWLRAYLASEMPGAVERVEVTADRVRIACRPSVPAVGLSLVEIEPWRAVADLGLDLTVLHFAGESTVDLPRYCEVGGLQYDRVFSKWALAVPEGDGYRLVSHARYADEIACERDLPRQLPARRKGIGGYAASRGHVEDLDVLGIHAVTVNIWLTGLMRAEGGAGRETFSYLGREYHVDSELVRSFDETLGETAKRGIVVSAILLVGHGSGVKDAALRDAFGHPDCEAEAQYSMPNLTSPEGFALYAASLHYLAERYCQPGDPHGRIHHWILHNEIDAGSVWTNCGDKPEAVYFDLYHRSMRISHAIARQYDRSARPFISLAHFWSWVPERRFYPGRNLLDLLVAFSRAEGDFEWALAHHPYPEDLFEPKSWLDADADDTYDARIVTFKNVEVLQAWADRRSTWFRGREPRVIHLSEQGTNSRDYTEQHLLEQAAGMAYAWQKLSVLPCIQSFQYHNWTDCRGEGGLRIGLRRFPDDPTDPGGAKPVWDLYRAFETSDEERACAFALPIVGIPDWSEARRPIPPAPE